MCIHTVTEPVNLLNANAAYRIVKTHEAIGGADEILIDNLTCSTLGQEENEHMAVVAAHVNIIRKYTGARVVVIHHEGKNHQRGARGGSALVGFADTALRIDEGKNGHMLYCVKQRDGARFSPVFLKLTPTPDGSTALFERLAEGPAVSLIGDKARDKAKLQAAIVAYVRDHPGVNTTDIAAGRRRQGVVDALAALEQAGRVRQEKKG